MLSYPSDEVGNHLFDEDTLDDSGAPDQLQTWGDIPVPAKLTEIK